MEGVIAAIVAEVLKYGAPGLIIAYLIWGIWQRERQLDACQTTIKELQEQRVKEASENAKALHEGAAAHASVARSVDLMADEVAHNTRAVDQLTGMVAKRPR